MIDLEEIKRDIEIRDKILEYLFQKYKEQPMSRCSPNELTEKLGFDSKGIDFNVRFLIDNGFIESISISRQFRIGRKGILLIEGPSKYNPPEDYRRQFIEISGSTIGQIIQAAHVDFSPSVLLNNLNQSIENHPQIPPEPKRHWRDFLAGIPKKVLDEVMGLAFRLMLERLGLGKNPQ